MGAKRKLKISRKVSLAPPKYRGEKWLQQSLPTQCEPWLEGKNRHAGVGKDLTHHRAVSIELREFFNVYRWKWPRKTIFFFSDLHADADAFIGSLLASGGVEKTGPNDGDFKLTKSGRKAVFVIGGDCFDKGPSNLRLLRLIRMLIDKKANVRILAGNHDVRMTLGVISVGLEPDPRTDHFFIRMGPKMIPFLKEIQRQYLSGKNAYRDIPDEKECRKRLYPTINWFSEFPRLARWVMPDDEVEREMRRLRSKTARFEQLCKSSGMHMREVFAAVKKWESLFLHPKGEFHWFFRRMKLLHQEGSFLFIHAGINDRTARNIQENGVDHVNREFNKQLRDDPFDFYYGPLAYGLRTKYRELDMPLTRRGTALLHKKGIHAIVHGHNNRLQGQRMMLRKGIIHFECDTTLDRNSRKKEGLSGIGAAVTIVSPQKWIMGISCDYPRIKVLEINPGNEE